MAGWWLRLLDRGDHSWIDQVTAEQELKWQGGADLIIGSSWIDEVMVTGD